MSKTKNSDGKKAKKNEEFCANPYKDHGKTRKGVHAITSEFAEKAKQLDISLQVNKYICLSCYTKINRGVIPSLSALVKPGPSGSGLKESGEVKRKRSVASTPKKYTSENSSSSESDIPEKKAKSLGSKKSSSDSCYDEYVKKDFSSIIEKLNDAFMDTDVTSIDKEKIRSSKKYSLERLNEITSFLAKYIFKVPNPNEDFNEMLSQLKEKFESVSNRSEKIKILTVLPKSWNQSKLQEHFKVTEYMATQAKKIVQARGTILCGLERKLGSKKLDDATINQVQEFYRTEMSRVCPGMRDYVTINDEGRKVRIQRLLLLMDLKEGYIEFKEKFPQHKIGFSKFAELRPPECVLALEKYGTLSTCVCQHHQNFKLMLTALQKIKIYEGVEKFRDLFERFICERNSDECHIGSCEACQKKRTETVKTLQEDIDKQMLEGITFMQWNNSTGGYILQSIPRTTDEFISYFQIKVNDLIPHDFISQKQSKYFTQRKENLKDNEMLIVCDFSENYTFCIQDAIQSYHWTKKQCTIHPFALYWKEGDELKMQSVIFIAESIKHDITAVYQFQVKLFEYIKQDPKFANIAERLKDVIFFSDGAGGQFKNRKNFFNMSQYKERFEFNVEWHFFATSHGKSACDGIGGTFKRNARRASIQNNIIRDAKELFDWAKKNDASRVLFFFCTQEEYETTSVELANRYVNVKVIKGTQSHHSFKAVGEGEILIRRFSSSDVFKVVKMLKEE